MKAKDYEKVETYLRNYHIRGLFAALKAVNQRAKIADIAKLRDYYLYRNYT